MDIDIITLEGRALRDLLDDLREFPDGIRTIRFARDGDTVKWKVNEDGWSLGQPLAAEDVRRLEQT